MPSPETSKDDWDAHVFVHCGWLSCRKCASEPDVMWAWDNVPIGDDAALVFTARVVPYLQNRGWTLDNDGLLCQQCSRKLN